MKLFDTLGVMNKNEVRVIDGGIEIIDIILLMLAFDYIKALILLCLNIEAIILIINS